MSKVLQERGFGSLPSSTETNPRDHVKSISTIVEADSYPICRMGSSQYAVSTRQNRTLMYKTKQMAILFLIRLNGASVSIMPLSTYLNLGLGELAHTKLTIELADRTMKYPKGTAENVLVGIGKFVFPIDFIILDMPEDIKVPLILGRPFLSTAQAKIDVFKRKITLRVREKKIFFKSVKPARSLMKRVYMLNLRRDQVDDLMPTIEEGEVVKEFRARNDARMGQNEIQGKNVVGALDAPTSKSDLLTELILSPQHINEFDLNDETSFSEYDEEEQNILYFNDLFPFNIIHTDDLKQKKTVMDFEKENRRMLVENLQIWKS
ncbi:putative reverse transcriptase domain-containing protein [Tanacetum coccineum]